MADAVLERKILLAVLGADPVKGELRSKIARSFARSKVTAKAVDGALRKLGKAGLVEEVERARGAVGLRVCDDARAGALLELGYAKGKLANARFTGRQVEQALAPLKAALAARVDAADEPEPVDEPEPPAPDPELEAERDALLATSQVLEAERDALRLELAQLLARMPSAAEPARELRGPALDKAILDAAWRLASQAHLPGHLVPVHQLRDAIDTDRAAFDRAMWRLAQAGRGRLQKLNDEALGAADRRADGFHHPFTGRLLYYFRPEDRR